MDPFVSYLVALSPIATPLVIQYGEPVAKYFGEVTVDVLKNLFKSNKSPESVAVSEYNQSLQDYIEQGIVRVVDPDWSADKSKGAYVESLVALQQFVSRPDVFVVENQLKEFYFYLKLARPVGNYGKYEEERKSSYSETARHFVELAWAEGRLHLVVTWLAQNRPVAFVNLAVELGN